MSFSSDNPPAEPFSWAEELRRVSQAVSRKRPRTSGTQKQVFYFLFWTSLSCQAGITVRIGRKPENAVPWREIGPDEDFPADLGEENTAILRQLLVTPRHPIDATVFVLDMAHGAEILQRMAHSGRLYATPDSPPLLLDEARSARVLWKTDHSGQQFACLRTTPTASLVIPLNPPWYVDLDDALIGRMDVQDIPEISSVLACLPPPSAAISSLTVEAWEADLTESEAGWFDLDMGIIVEGQRLPLAPLLAALFRRDPRWLDAWQLARIDNEEIIELKSAPNGRIGVPAKRLKPLAMTLIDLFDGKLHDGTRLRLSRFDAPRLSELNDPARWQFRGQADVMNLAERLSAARGVTRIEPPAGLGLKLRGYQEEGLSWLQFLREHQLSGILADDMGLGKTAQALAHLLLEKEAGRLDCPALIVLPTSLVFNWKNEAARFAPGLSVLALHGAERKARFAEIPQHDVVLTTYSLLWRDAEELTRQRFHLLILDEAQTVKNARSQGAEIVRRIDARHRLCLTGTPLENHLGELWSQFDFLLPGFLGDSNNFARYWRTPIEKGGDRERRELLARRIRPFILRRRKEEVARELPEKTIIVRKLELSGAQRDLYETVRVAMSAVVREEVESKGFGRSQIVILDALLKLRQVCCDPRLLRSPAAKRVTERAKLDLLMTMLPEQVDEGRHILLFSQFTSMLALIEVELQKAGLSYVTLTGSTIDRETPIKRFQNGEVPIFLISLKAGGLGLNLTAADTVIHYDPWWNPAVEHQATDRAHRIGQEKPVFVYKLIVAGSIEEKILALQERKAELAEGILSADHHVSFKFGEDDLATLFAPL